MLVHCFSNSPTWTVQPCFKTYPEAIFHDSCETIHPAWGPYDSAETTYNVYHVHLQIHTRILHIYIHGSMIMCHSPWNLGRRIAARSSADESLSVRIFMAYSTIACQSPPQNLWLNILPNDWTYIYIIIIIMCIYIYLLLLLLLLSLLLNNIIITISIIMYWKTLPSWEVIFIYIYMCTIQTETCRYLIWCFFRIKLQRSPRRESSTPESLRLSRNGPEMGRIVMNHSYVVLNG